MNDCIFCRIIAGEIPSERVYEDDKMIVIRDVAPAAPVHVLMIPKAHTENIITAEPELLLYMFGKVKELAEKLGVNEKIFINITLYRCRNFIIQRLWNDCQYSFFSC